MTLSQFHRKMLEAGTIPSEKIYGRRRPTGKGSETTGRNKGIRRAWKKSRRIHGV